MINTSQKSKTSDRYGFRDVREVIEKKSTTSSPTNSLCIDCYDYYDVPPCQTNFSNNGTCFPSLISPDRN